MTHARTEIIIRATHTQEVLGEKGRRIRELTALVQKRFRFPEGSVELYAEKVQARGLSAVAQAESLRYKLLGGLAVRRACYGVLRFIMESGAKGCEVVVSGKLRAARAKSMKFTDGFMIQCVGLDLALDADVLQLRSARARVRRRGRPPRPPAPGRARHQSQDVRRTRRAIALTRAA